MIQREVHYLDVQPLLLKENIVDAWIGDKLNYAMHLTDLLRANKMLRIPDTIGIKEAEHLRWEQPVPVAAMGPRCGATVDSLGLATLDLIISSLCLTKLYNMFLHYCSQSPPILIVDRGATGKNHRQQSQQIQIYGAVYSQFGFDTGVPRLGTPYEEWSPKTHPSFSR